MKLGDRHGALAAAVDKVSETTGIFRDVADSHTRLRRALTQSSRELRHAQQVRDDAIRDARAEGLTYRELRAATGYSRSYLDWIVTQRQDRSSSRAHTSESNELIAPDPCLWGQVDAEEARQSAQCHQSEGRDDQRVRATWR